MQSRGRLIQRSVIGVTLVFSIGVESGCSGAGSDPNPGSSGGANAGGSPESGGSTSSGGLASAGGSGMAGASASGSSCVDANRPPASNASWIYVLGYQLFVGRREVNGSLPTPIPYKIKGVAWAPVPKGERNSVGYSERYTQFADQDVPLIAGLNANTVRTYNAFELNNNGLAVLDKLHAQGIMVIMTVMPSWWESRGKAYLHAVNQFKTHPAVLMWALGNELNYNNLYYSISRAEAIQIVRTAIDDIHQADCTHPVVVSWGNEPSVSDVEQLSQADIWSLNLYPHLDIAPRFNIYASRSKKPMFVGEYGADAWNAVTGREDSDAQAEATRQLTEQIQVNYSAKVPSRPVLGGTIFELTDEWWKSTAAGSSDATHDQGGFNNNGVYPDGVANEEWWGLLTIDRQPRKAYDTLKELYATP